MKYLKCQTVIRRVAVAAIEMMERRMLMSGTPVSLDPTFGTGGKVVGASPPAVFGELTAYDPVNSDVIVVGSTADYSGHELQEFTSTGVINASFSSIEAVTSPGVGTSISALVQSDGKILVLSQDEVSFTDAKFFLTRYTTTGAVDPTFGTAGTVEYELGVTPFSPNYGVSSFLLLPNGSIVIPGGTLNGTSALAMLTNAGKPATAFGNNGIATGVAGYLNTATTDPNGNLEAVGYTSAVATSPAGALGAGLVERFSYRKTGQFLRRCRPHHRPEREHFHHGSGNG